MLDEELARTLAEPSLRSALAVVLDPRDGRVLAMQSLEGDARDPELPARVVRSHGSVGKTFTVAAALDRGLVSPGDSFAGDEFSLGGMRVADGQPHGAMTLGDVLAFSSNVGTAHVFERLGRDALVDALARFHLAERIPAEAREDDSTAARLAIGVGLEATPLELAVAFAAVADGGVLHAPWREGSPSTPGERVISPEAAATCMALLEGAVSRDDGTGRRARVPGHRVAGKTGTMPLGDGTMHGVFVGAVPVEAPRLVVLVGVISESAEYSGGTVAAPAFARIAARLLSE